MDSATLVPVLADLINGPGFLGILIVIGLFLGSAVLGLFFFFYILIKELASSKKPPEPSKPPELPKPSEPPELPESSKSLELPMPLESPKPSKLYKMPELPDRREDGLGIQPASIIHRAKKTMQRIFLHLGYGVFGMASVFFVFCGMSFFYLQEPDSQDSLLVEIAASLLLLFLGLFFYRIHRWINRRMIAPHASDSPETGKPLEPPELSEGELANQSKGT